MYSSTNKKLVVQLAINCLLVSIDRKEFNDCESIMVDYYGEHYKNVINTK